MEFGDSTLRYKHALDPCPDAGMFSRHAHPQYELLYFIKGEAEIMIEGHRHPLQSGELVVIPPMQYHFIRITQSVPYERAVLNFLEPKVPQRILEQVFSAPKILRAEEDLFTRMERFAAFPTEDRATLCRNLLTELLYLLSRGEERQGFSPYYNEVITTAVGYIEEHLTTLTSPDEVAEALFVSRAQLYRSFRDAFGIPPMKYITEKRLLMADARIRGGEKPAHAAANCGFGDYS
ncbi:MAG: helix-turn-helix transcriptional regulator, partial [Clostridia bacterium]|nr:helix-turn-helix transcriptional regulator [Clostridia bacterium]